MPFLLQVFQQESQRAGRGMLCAVAVMGRAGNAAGTRVTGGQSLKILGI